jgi:hypothetical protein
LIGKRQKLIGFAFLILNLGILSPYSKVYVLTERYIRVQTET